MIVMARAVERAVRTGISPGDRLRTPSQGAPFTVRDITQDGVVLLFGKKETPTPLSWATLEGVAEFLGGGRWVVIGSVFDVQGDASTLDGYLKQYIKRATAGWVAALLERAGVVEIDRGRPARVRIRPGFGGGATT